MAFGDSVTSMDRVALATFGETVTYTPTVGSPPPAPVTPTGIFSAPFVLAEGDAHAGVEAQAPKIFLLLADLPTDPDVDQPTLTIRGDVYRVVEVDPDGMGGVLITLRLVA